MNSHYDTISPTLESPDMGLYAGQFERGSRRGKEKERYPAVGRRELCHEICE